MFERWARFVESGRWERTKNIIGRGSVATLMIFTAYMCIPALYSLKMNFQRTKLIADLKKDLSGLSDDQAVLQVLAAERAHVAHMTGDTQLAAAKSRA